MGQIEEQNSDIEVHVENSATSDLQIKFGSDIQNKESKKKYKCNYPDCHAMFLRSSRLERHIRLHTGERPYKCSYPECTKSYTNSSHLKRHLETHNPTKKLYKCPECSVAISYLHNLRSHYKRMHSEKRISCKECNEAFNKKHQLVKHQTVVHSIAPTIYKCDKCTKSYQNHTRFKRHQETHKKKSYPCPEPGCSKVFDKWPLLRTHRKMQHITHYKCDTCNKVFLSKSTLRIHCKIHFKDRLVLPCPYDDCQRIYFFQSNLKEHVRIKHLGKKFYCDMCSMGVTSKQKLIEHIQRHYKPKEKKEKPKKQRKKRKDAGIPKRSVLTALIGVNLPHNLEKLMMERETITNDITVTLAAS